MTKRTLLLSWLAVVLAFVLPPLLTPPTGSRPPAEASAAPSPTQTAQPEETPARTPVLDESILLAVKTENGTVEMTMAEYLPGALAAEMPAAFHAEALKAQAVALRTYALHYRAARKDAHPDADICTSSGCCAAWTDETVLRERWGEGFQFYSEKLAAAVRATDGQHLVYEDMPILAVFHASSAGQTESGEALGVPKPYLQSVSSPETAENVTRLISEVEVSPTEFKASVLSAAPTAAFGDDPAAWLGSIERSETGRVAHAVIGGTPVSGLALRQLFSLRSTDFTLRWTGSSFLFAVSGYGHGLGMSQYGADLLAEEGADYTAILDHYYSGSTLVMAMSAE